MLNNICSLCNNSSSSYRYSWIRKLRMKSNTNALQLAQSFANFTFILLCPREACSSFAFFSILPSLKLRVFCPDFSFSCIAASAAALWIILCRYLLSFRFPDSPVRSWLCIIKKCSKSHVHRACFKWSL